MKKCHGGLACNCDDFELGTVGYDEVSGNPIPAGSSDTNVRDDIPAALSDGEYVVPADVVRYHGLKTFVDMYDEAKMGLMMMQAEGQIKSLEDEEYDEDAGAEDEDIHETPEGNKVEKAVHKVVEEEKPRTKKTLPAYRPSVKITTIKKK